MLDHLDSLGIPYTISKFPHWDKEKKWYYSVYLLGKYVYADTMEELELNLDAWLEEVVLLGKTMERSD
jgi:hypothetical protein